MDHVLMIALALICTGLPIWLGARHGLLAVVSPLHLVGYLAGLGFLAKVVVYAAAPELAFFAGFAAAPGAALRGALYLGGFIMLLCLGYRLACRPQARAPGVIVARQLALRVQPMPALVALGVAVALGTVLLILQARGLSLTEAGTLAILNQTKQININDAGVGATLAGIKTLFVIPKCAFVLCLAQWIVAPRAGLAAMVLLLAGVLAGTALISGDRFEVIELGVYALATYAILGGRLRAGTVAVGACAAAALGALAVHMTYLRLGPTEDMMLRQIVGSTYFLDINVPIMLIGHLQPDQMLGGQSYGWWLFGWVPRDVWPDKPAIDLGVYFKREVMGLAAAGAFNITGPGEAYVNFGWAGLAVAPVLGALFRLAETVVLDARRAARTGCVFLYPLLVYPFVQASLQSSFSAFVVGGAAQLVLLVALRALFIRRLSWRLLPSERSSHA